MVTRTVIRITPSEASTPASAVTAEGPIDGYAPATKQINKPAHHPKPKKPLCNHPSCTKRAEHPSPLCWMHGAKECICSFVGCKNRGILLGLCPEHGGLVQLCRHGGCINEVNFEKSGGLCRMHQVGPMDGEQSDSEDDDCGDDGGEIRLCSFRGCISDAITDEGLCDRHSAHNCSSFNEGEESHLERKRQPNSFVIDLSDVPPQPAIPKSDSRVKEGASKYKGVCFNKQMNKWLAHLTIEGKQRCIGYYENEEEAAVDYARAVYKFKGQGALERALDKARKQKPQSLVIDLSDVPPKQPIPKSKGRRGGASKYTGVTFNKQKNSWQPQIMIEGKQHTIGYYGNEEEAAIDYARAFYKYSSDEERKKRKRQPNSFVIDLSDVPPQPPIPKSAGHIKEGASKYKGVTFYEKMKTPKWLAQIMIEGKQRCIGYYENEEEAAVDYARAVYKYKGQGARERALDKAKKKKPQSLVIDLSDVPPQPPIPKSDGRVKEGASKYTGVSFRKQGNDWAAQIMIEGKQYRIGYYENEEEAAVDYARALYKYKGQGALDKAREQKKSLVSGVPHQQPIPKTKGRRGGASKYTGVVFRKKTNRWEAKIDIEGKKHTIGSYGNEEEAAIDYARALFKYRKQEGSSDNERKKRKRHCQKSFDIDCDVPPQSSISETERHTQKQR